MIEDPPGKGTLLARTSEASERSGSGLLPMASPVRDLSVALANDHIVVASVSLRLDRREAIEKALQYRLGVTETPFLADVEHKCAATTGPDIVRFHEVGDSIRTAIDGAARSTWVVLSAKFLEDIVAGTSSWRAPFARPFTYPPLPVLGDLHRFLAQAKAGAGTLWAEEELVALLPKLLRGANGERPVLRHRPGMVRLARDADAVLAADFARVASLADLAHRLDVSASYLARAYRAATGGTLHARVRRLRLASALGRLADGAKDLTELALELGYSSHSHFTAEFRRFVGRAPSDYRLSTQM